MAMIVFESQLFGAERFRMPGVAERGRPLESSSYREVLLEVPYGRGSMHSRGLQLALSRLQRISTGSPPDFLSYGPFVVHVIHDSHGKAVIVD
jgi:hypothetical protein